MLRDRDPGDETAHVPDFHFYTGAPVPRNEVDPAIAEWLDSKRDRVVRGLDRQCPHPVEDAFAPALTVVEFVDMVTNPVPVQREYADCSLHRPGGPRSFCRWPDCGCYARGVPDVIEPPARDGVVFIGPWGAFPA